MKKILLHICCGPCATYPMEVLQGYGYDVMGYFGNPNIHPYTEYLKRRHSVEQLAAIKKIKVVYENDYNPVYYFNTIAFRESKRCFLCYQMRLEQAAHIAKKGKFDYFTTSLLVSKRQKHDLIKQVGEYTGHKYGIPFLYEDFRIGYEKSRESAKEMDLYRQQYCGCLYSEYERWAGRSAVDSVTARKSLT